MKTSFQIAKIFGIPIKVHFSFIFILALFTWVFSIETIHFLGFIIGFGDLDVSLEYKIVLGAITSILLFIGVLLHELGHSYVANEYGQKVNKITLFIFGGSAESDEIPEDSEKEIRIAISGPLVSIFLGLLFYLVYFFTTLYFNNLFAHIISITFGTLSFYNLLLAGFNLLPAFPTDGGRILRSGLAMRMDYQKATKTASNIGKAFAILLAVLGIFYNFWLILIAIFIFFGAYQEQQTVKISEALKGKKINEIMKTDIDSASPDTTIQEVYEKMEKDKTFVYPIVKNEKLYGKVTIQDLKYIDRKLWMETNVSQVMNTEVTTVSPDEDAFSIFKILIKKGLDKVFVEDEEKLLGYITRNDLLNTIRFYDINKKL